MAHVAPNVRTSSATLANLKANGLAGLIDLLITANTALADPSATAPTISATGGGSTGGTLPAGAYWVAYAWSNGVGQTLVKRAAATFTITLGNIPRVTVPALPTGASDTYIFLSAAGGSSGSETLYTRGVTGTTVDLSTATFDDSLRTIPTANTTQAATIVALTDAIKNGNAQKIFRGFESQLDSFLNGDPSAYDAVRTTLLQNRAAFQFLSQAMDDAIGLVDANHGTLGTTTTFAGVPRAVRTI